MTDDIVARLRAWIPCYRADTDIAVDMAAAADEIERLRKELGQVSDADSWVSQVDAAHLDSLLNWCEFNAMDWHRALARLVNDRARLRGEVNRLRAERDEARREVCYLTAELDMINHTSVTAESIALEYEWDCFKEEADHNNNHFRTHHK